MPAVVLQPQEGDLRAPLGHGVKLAIATAGSVSASTSAEPATRTWFQGFRFVHSQRPAIHLRAIQGSNSHLSLFGCGHFYKSEAAGLSGKLVRHHAADSTVRCAANKLVS